MKKKISFKSLKSGQKFRYKRKLYLKDSAGYPVQLSCGKILFSDEQEEIYFDGSTLVTPIKVKITVQ